MATVKPQQATTAIEHWTCYNCKREFTTPMEYYPCSLEDRHGRFCAYREHEQRVAYKAQQQHRRQDITMPPSDPRDTTRPRAERVTIVGGLQGGAGPTPSLRNVELLTQIETKLGMLPGEFRRAAAEHREKRLTQIETILGMPPGHINREVTPHEGLPPPTRFGVSASDGFVLEYDVKTGVLLFMKNGDTLITFDVGKRQFSVHPDIQIDDTARHFCEAVVGFLPHYIKDKARE